MQRHHSVLAAADSESESIQIQTSESLAGNFRDSRFSQCRQFCPTSFPFSFGAPLKFKLNLSLVVLFLICLPLDAGGPKIRKSLDDLTPVELENYLHAFKVLKSQPASSLASYSTFERLHNGGALPNGKQGGCVHASTDFLPWHRILLVQFETALQNSDPPRTSNVTLPYWDFSKPPTGRRFPKALEDQSSVLWHANRFNLLPDAPPNLVEAAKQLETERRDQIMAPATLTTLYGLGRWRDGSGTAGFSNRLESSPHNWMHVPFCQGDMGVDTTAARDPLFWSYHCYIDFMWFQWQTDHNAFEGAEPALLPGDLTKLYDAFPKPMTVGAVLNPDKIGYTYVLTASTEAVPKMIAGTKLKALSGEKFKFHWNTPITTESVDGGKVGASVTVAGVKHTGEGSWQIELYLHPGSVKPDYTDEQFRKKYFVANHVEWKGSHRHAHGGHMKDLILRLTEKQVRESLQDENDYVLSVNYRAIPASLQEFLSPKTQSLESPPLEYKSLSVKFD